MGHGKGGGGCVMIDWSGGHSGWESVGWGLSVCEMYRSRRGESA